MKPCDTRLDGHAPNTTTLTYGADQSGVIRYDFNSCGYRGEEYDPSAKFKLCVIGESHAFGTGVAQEETFGHKLKQHIAAALGLGRGEVNVTNLSAGGVSADYCVRTLYRQIPECAADLVILHLPPPNRTEYIDGRQFHSFRANSLTKDNIGRVPLRLLAFCDYYNQHMGSINAVKNALLAQAFLRERKINYVLATQDGLAGLRDIEYAKAYADQLDTGAVFQHRYFLSRADLAADGHHGGPRCHAAFAIALLGLFGEMQMARGNADLGRRICSHASDLRANDQEWMKCNLHIAKRMRKREGGKR